jgi:hypothetical protein
MAEILGERMMESFTHRLRRIYSWSRIILAATLLLPVLALGQQPAGAGASNSSSKPDSPQPKQDDSSSGVQGTTDRFIGYVTNRSFFFPDIASSPQALSPGGKFKIFVNQSISPAYILAAATSAAFNQATNSPGSTGQGWDAYGTRVGYSMARASSTSFFGTFLFASILRQDPRFFPENHPSLGRAIKYSAKRLVITRNDKGNDVFNTSGLLGPLAAETLANVYLPVSEQTGARTMERYGSDLAWRFAANMFKEYWPTFFHDMHLQSLKVLPNPSTMTQP